MPDGAEGWVRHAGIMRLIVRKTHGVFPQDLLHFSAKLALSFRRQRCVLQPAGSAGFAQGAVFSLWIRPALGVDAQCLCLKKTPETGGLSAFFRNICYVFYARWGQYLIFSSRSMAEIFSMVVRRVGTNGRRSWFSIMPMACSMALTPAGLPSTNSSLNSSANL